MFVMCHLLLANLSFCHVSFVNFVAMEDENSGAKAEAMEDENSGEKAEEVVHVCHVSFVACKSVILSCVICQAIYELDMFFNMPSTCTSSA